MSRLRKSYARCPADIGQLTWLHFAFQRFPAVLEEERRLDIQLYPERYAHIWEGEYAKAFEGAYFARHLEQARQQGRIGHVAVDAILPVKAFFDIGGA